MRKLITFILLATALQLKAQQKVDHFIIVTTDGFRWQEVFRGMDSAIANQQRFNQRDSAYIFDKYWDADAEKRRKKLMPFLWSFIEKKGQIYGNRDYNNKVDNANHNWFSFPGYSEIFTGYVDTMIKSNDYPGNPNINVLEFINKQPLYKGNVAAFCAWGAFNNILNEKRSGFTVIAAFDSSPLKTGNTILINKMLKDSYKPFKDGECLDVFTHYSAMEYFKINKPKVMYISYGETDEWAHAGMYRDYLNSVNQVDKWLAEIWDFIQTHAEYKNRTALLVTVDHGRGYGNDWTDHWSNVPGSGEIWFAVIAPGLPAKGEVKKIMQIYQQQFAQTIASLLHLKFVANHPVAEAISEIHQR